MRETEVSRSNRSVAQTECRAISSHPSGLSTRASSAFLGSDVDHQISDEWFDVQICRNCDAALTTPYCAHCGQKAAKRLVWKDLGKETWQRIRYFEMRSAKTAWRLLLSPGTVARAYVMGRRKANMHPLTLLIALVAILALLIAANRYFEINRFAGRNADVDRVAQRVLAYANWSFSLGIFAIFLGSWIVFRRRLNYNALEHGVLAIYGQSLILMVSILNLLPTLIWRSPAFVLSHKIASEYYLPVIKLLIVAAAYKQFFLLKWRYDWAKLAAACVVYAALSWALVRAYAAAILWWVAG